MRVNGQTQRPRKPTELRSSWPPDPSSAYERWFGGKAMLVSALGLLLASVNPPHGTGVTVCWLKLSTGLPCIGCGLTRSLSCALRGMFAESLRYHPFGIFILLVFVAAIVAGVLPTIQKQRLMCFMAARAIFFNGLFTVFVILFVSYGAARFLHEMFGVN